MIINIKGISYGPEATISAATTDFEIVEGVTRWEVDVQGKDSCGDEFLHTYFASSEKSATIAANQINEAVANGGGTTEVTIIDDF
jgi:hypothetical protein